MLDRVDAPKDGVAGALSRDRVGRDVDALRVGLVAHRLDLLDREVRHRPLDVDGRTMLPPVV